MLHEYYEGFSENIFIENWKKTSDMFFKMTELSALIRVHSSKYYHYVSLVYYNSWKGVDKKTFAHFTAPVLLYHSNFYIGKIKNFCKLNEIIEHVNDKSRVPLFVHTVFQYKNDLQEWFEEFYQYYGSTYVTMKLHSLFHILIYDTLSFGKKSNSSTASFENKGGSLRKVTIGTKNVPSSIAREISGKTREKILYFQSKTSFFEQLNKQKSTLNLIYQNNSIKSITIQIEGQPTVISVSNYIPNNASISVCDNSWIFCEINTNYYYCNIVEIIENKIKVNLFKSKDNLFGPFMLLEEQFFQTITISIEAIKRQVFHSYFFQKRIVRCLSYHLNQINLRKKKRKKK